MRSPPRCSAGSRARSAPLSAASLLGLFTTLLGAYVDFISVDLELPIAFTILILVLLFRPAGLLGKPRGEARLMPLWLRIARLRACSRPR